MTAELYHLAGKEILTVDFEDDLAPEVHKGKNTVRRMVITLTDGRKLTIDGCQACESIHYTLE